MIQINDAVNNLDQITQINEIKMLLKTNTIEKGKENFHLNIFH